MVSPRTAREVVMSFSEARTSHWMEHIRKTSKARTSSHVVLVSNASFESKKSSFGGGEDGDVVEGGGEEGLEAWGESVEKARRGWGEKGDRRRPRYFSMSGVLVGLS